MTLHIRQANTADAPAISKLLMSTAPQLLTDPTTPEAVRFLENFTEPAVATRLSAPNYLHFIALADQNLRGYISMRDKQHIYHMFVQPEFQGQGIARLLWNQLLEIANPTPITVNSSLLAAPIYRRFGFVPNGAAQPHHCPPFIPMIYTENSRSVLTAS